MFSQSLMVRDVVRDCLEKEPSDRTESDIRESPCTFVWIVLLIVLWMYSINSVYFLCLTEALLDFMQHLPVSFFASLYFLPFRNQGKTAVNTDMHSNAFLTTKRVLKQCICYGLNLFPVQIFLNWFIFFKLVHIFQTSLYFSNWFIFIKLVHIFQTGSYFSNWVEIFKPV